MFARIHKKIIQALAALAFATSATPGHAACCVFDSVSIVTAVGAASTAITTAVLGSAVAITSAIKGAQQAQAANNRETATLISDTVIRTAETMDRQKQEARYSMTDPCSVAAPTAAVAQVMTGTSAATTAAEVGRGGAAAATGGSAGGGGGGGGGGKYTPIGASASMQQVMAVRKGVAEAPSVEAGLQAAAKGACESFVAGNPNDPRAKACQGAGFGTGNAVGFANADVRADTVIDGPQGTQPKKRYSVDLAGRDGTAIEAYLGNINSPVMQRALRPGELSTDEGRRYMALKDTYDARMSLAEHPVRRHIGQISSNATTISYVETLLQSKDAPFVQAYLAEQAPNWQTKGVSADEIRNIEVRRRYTNPQWQLRMASASPEEVAREQLQVQALQAQLTWDLIQEVRELGLVQSGTALASVRAEMLPQLAAQHRAAAR